jgi:dihydrofolate reductase
MQIILSHFLSLDGVAQAPGGAEEDTSGGFAHGGWSMPYFDLEAMGPVLDSVLQRSDAILFGRRTWQVAAAAWPNQSGDPFSDKINAVTKYVASRTLTDEDMQEWDGSQLLPADDALGAIRALREQEGGGLYVLGSATLAQALVDADLVDEYVLMLEPLLLGGGKSIFPASGNKRRLELVSAEPTSTGVVMLTYHARRD